MFRGEKIMRTVIVFEPDKVLRSLYKEELEEEGYHVYLVKDDCEALDLLKKTPVNILVTEHQFEPTESYTNLLNMAREVKKIPVIILSSHPRAFIDLEWWGEIEYVNKTSNLGVLKETMKEMLDYRCCADNFYRGGSNVKEQEFYF